jgi:glycerophosphoryl diester phosphodiesterase
MGYFAAPHPRVFGHRGAAGLAPENTLPSFALAGALGADTLELDVHGSRDGEIVVLHDATLERTTNGEGLVRDHGWDRLARLDAGYRFTFDGRTYPYRGQGIRLSRLAALLAAFPGHRFNIETKSGEPAVVEEVVALLDRAGVASRTLLAAEQGSVMARIRAAAGRRIVTGMSAEEVAAFVDRARREDWAGYEPPGRALQIPPSFGGVRLATREHVEAAHRFGIEVHVWTINDPGEIDAMLDLGVDGVMSDFPGRVRAAVERRS